MGTIACLVLSSRFQSDLDHCRPLFVRSAGLLRWPQPTRSRSDRLTTPQTFNPPQDSSRDLNDTQHFHADHTTPILSTFFRRTASVLITYLQRSSGGWKSGGGGGGSDPEGLSCPDPSGLACGHGRPLREKTLDQGEAGGSMAVSDQ